MVEELLKKIEECENSIDYEKHRDKYLDKLVHSYPILSLSEEKELFKLYRTNYERKYKDIIFKCHLRDVYDTCKDTSGYRDDLISEGIVLLYEFLNYYDYTMPYMTFTKALVTRLSVFYNSKIIENNKSLDTKMSVEELKEHEDNGECLTNTNEIKHRKIKKEKLTIVLKERINIIYNEEDKDYIYKKMFNSKTKKLYNRPFDKYLDY